MDIVSVRITNFLLYINHGCNYCGPRTYQRSASKITVLAHLLGLTALVLLIFWLLHYREGLDLDSENPSRVFNVKFSISI